MVFFISRRGDAVPRVADLKVLVIAGFGPIVRDREKAASSTGTSSAFAAKWKVTLRTIAQ